MYYIIVYDNEFFESFFNDKMIDIKFFWKKLDEYRVEGKLVILEEGFIYVLFYFWDVFGRVGVIK